MTRAKSTAHLREGLPSKIYFLAYPEPITRVQISEKIYPGKKTQSSRVLNWIQIMIVKDYLKGKKRLTIISKPLLLKREIYKELKKVNVILTIKERKTFSLFADTKLRMFMKTINSPIPKGDLNAYSILTFYIGFIAQMKLLLDNRKYKEIEQLNLNIPNNDTEQLKIIMESKLDKELCMKLQNLSTFDIKPFFELGKTIFDSCQKTTL